MEKIIEQGYNDYQRKMNIIDSEYISRNEYTLSRLMDIVKEAVKGNREYVNLSLSDIIANVEEKYENNLGNDRRKEEQQAYDDFKQVCCSVTDKEDNADKCFDVAMLLVKDTKDESAEQFRAIFCRLVNLLRETRDARTYNA